MTTRRRPRPSPNPPLMLREQAVWLDVVATLACGWQRQAAGRTDGVAGVTSNPSIFVKAIAGTADLHVGPSSPAQRYSFGTMTSARAAGDFALVSARGRRLVRIDPWRDVVARLNAAVAASFVRAAEVT